MGDQIQNVISFSLTSKMINLKCIVAFCLCLTYAVQANPVTSLKNFDLKNFDLENFDIENLNFDLENFKIEDFELIVEGLKEFQNDPKLLSALQDLQNEFMTIDERKLHPDLGLNVKRLIKKNGYPIETHVVTTQDGYILELHRIPYGKKNSTTGNRPIALVMPGILCSSADWIISGPDKGLGYILADEGYDVWLGNVRGTTWGRKHRTLSTKDKEFWNFSYYEMGTLDLPAIIDYVLEKAGQEKLFYIAHSQGTTSYFVLTSELPEYNNKIRLMTALAPVAYMSRIKNPFIKFAMLFFDQIQEFAERHNINNILSHNAAITILGQTLCSDGTVTQKFCPLILFIATGFDGPQLNKTNLPVLFSNFPAGLSLKQIWHFCQSIRSGKFGQYDYGLKINLERYGQEIPPQYNVSKITSPVAAFYATNDWILNEVDAQQLIGELPNVVFSHEVGYKRFNHMDYMWAIDAPTLVYDYVLDLMKNY